MSFFCLLIVPRLSPRYRTLMRVGGLVVWVVAGVCVPAGRRLARGNRQEPLTAGQSTPKSVSTGGPQILGYLMVQTCTRFVPVVCTFWKIPANFCEWVGMVAWLVSDLVLSNTIPTHAAFALPARSLIICFLVQDTRLKDLVQSCVVTFCGASTHEP